MPNKARKGERVIVTTSYAVRKYHFHVMGVGYSTFVIAVIPAVITLGILISGKSPFLIFQYVGVYLLVMIIVYWAVIMPLQKKWFAWAFVHVDSVHELNTATAEVLGINVGEEIERLEKADPELAKFIKFRFDNESYFYNDDTVLPEYVIRRGKRNSWLYLVGAMPFWFLLLLAIFRGGLRTTSVFATLTLFVAGHLISVLDRKVRLILNEDGITLGTDDFAPWTDISEEQITKRRFNKQYRFYLSFYNKDVHCLFLVDYFDKTVEELRHMLIVYRYRYEMSCGNQEPQQPESPLPELPG